jgi:transaldolase
MAKNYSGINSSKYNIKLYADGANLADMIEEYNKGFVSGFTTNPTLMKKAGVLNYERFAHDVLKSIPDLPISFEVFSDDLATMEKEARIISSWGDNVYIKIPITNTKGDCTAPVVKKLSNEGLKLNITAVLTLEQVKLISEALSPGTDSIVSIFAGRIADTGIDPMPIMKEAKTILSTNPKAELLWASTRELLNLFQAEACGCHIITITNDILKKIHLIGKDLSELSLETVNMFYMDAQSAGYKI